jgi:predicted RNA-binding Zn-ribbon protein involved in translation (DUF1610 family)
LRIHRSPLAYDLASIKVKDENGNYTRDNQQKIKLKKLAYIRKVQFQMQHESDKVMNFIRQWNNPEKMVEQIGELISPYKEGGRYADLPVEKIWDMLQQFKQFTEDKNERAKNELMELDSAEELKSGVVANMVGVVAYFMKKYEYNAYISLENLCRAYNFATDGLTGRRLPNTAADSSMDFKEQENLQLAGLGTYHFFEMQLLRKLFCIQTETEIIHLVPTFRSVDNYENIHRLTKINHEAEYTCKPFGMVHFVDPRNTSKKCPVCGGVNINRNRKDNDIVKCKDCGFVSKWDEETKIKNNQLIQQYGMQDKNIEYIKNGDDNGAYHIALKTLKNLNKNKKG